MLLGNRCPADGLMALDIGPGDAVFTTPFTFIATAEVISLLGATPIFVDIDSRTFNINSERLYETARRLFANPCGLRPRAIISVDLFGLPADYYRLNSIASSMGLSVIEDAAQSFGSRYGDRMAGSLGTISCTSFFPSKPLGCYGDGGMCFTEDPSLASALRSIREHGRGDSRLESVRLGINGRLDTIQAAILKAKFSIFLQEMQLRSRVADIYTDALSGAGFVLPFVPSDCTSAWAQYSLLAASTRQKEKIRKKFKRMNIPIGVYYPIPLHLQPVFQRFGFYPDSFPVSESCADRIFSLPIHPYLSWDDQMLVVDTLLSCEAKR